MINILKALQVEIKQTKLMYLLYLQLLIVCYLLQKTVYRQIVYKRRAATTRTSERVQVSSLHEDITLLQKK